MPDSQINQTKSTTGNIYYGYIVVAASFIIMVTILGLHSSFGVFFTPIVSEFNWTRAVTSGAYSVSQLMHGLMSIVTGWLNDRFGPRVVLSICGILTAIGYVLMSHIQEAWHLYIAYGLLIGAGSAIFAPLLSTVARWFYRRRSMMSGLVTGGIGVGVLIAPLIINFLILEYDWRKSCIILAVAIIVIVVLAAQLLKKDPAKLGQHIDGSSTVLPVQNIPITAPATTSNHFKNAVLTWQFWIVFGILFCSGYTSFSVQIHIVPLACDAGFSSTAAAGILSAMGGASIIGEMGVGSIGDKLGNKTGFIIGFILMSCPIILLFFNPGLLLFYFFAVIFGMGLGNNTTQESPLVAWLFGLKSHGSIFGTLVLGFTLGGAIGTLTSGYIFDITGNYTISFMTAIIIGVLGIVLSAIIKPLSIKKSSTSQI